MSHLYKITKQYGRGSETSLPERFKELNEAKSFVNEKLQEDAAMGVKATYRIYEDDEVHSEYDSSNITLSREESSSSQGKGSGSSFSPTPFSTAPRPSGTPQKWIKDEGDGDKKK